MSNGTETTEKRIVPLVWNNTTAKPMLLLFGSWIFAYLLGVTIHEIGHAIAAAMLGYTNIRIFLHPFELSYVTSTLNSSSLFFSISGPVVNLIVASIITLAFWRIRNQYTLPILMLGPAAFIPEGVAMIMDATAYPHSNADWVRAVEFGLPLPVLGIMALVTLAIGCYIFFQLIPLFYDIRKNDSKIQFFMILTAIPIWYFLNVIYSSVFDLNRLVRKAIIFASSIALIILFSISYNRQFSNIEKSSLNETNEITWKTVWLSLSLAVLIISIQLLTYYVSP